MLAVPEELGLPAVLVLMLDAGLPLAPLLAAAPLPAAALVAGGAVFVLEVAGLLGFDGAAVGGVGAVLAVVIAGCALVAVLGEVVLPSRELLVFELGADGAVSGAHAGANTTNKPTNPQHTLRIQHSLLVSVQPTKHRIAARAAYTIVLDCPGAGYESLCTKHVEDRASFLSV